MDTIYVFKLFDLHVVVILALTQELVAEDETPNNMKSTQKKLGEDAPRKDMKSTQEKLGSGGARSDKSSRYCFLRCHFPLS